MGSARSDGGMSGLTGVCPVWSATAGFADDHAHLVSPASSESAIYVKSSQHYSVDLHRFCTLRGLAPKVLGFKRLSGGWFAVVMEKVNIMDPRIIASFPEAGEWERCFKELVDNFHREDFVHGNLRLAYSTSIGEGRRGR